MRIRLKRVYAPPAPGDGRRILVERLWPRGISKEAARLDHWAKDLAPSPALRTWFAHDPAKWDGFRARYFRELDMRADAVADLRDRMAGSPATFVFASREERFNNAVALKEYLERDDG